MRRSVPFIRRLAAVLAVVMLQASVVGAVSPAPGSLAILEPPMPLPEMRAVWDGIRNGIYLDPLLLVRGREEVLKELEEWRQAAQAVRSAHIAADRITLDRAQILLEKAWAYYFQFDFEQATEVLSETKKLLLLTPGDSGFRTRLMFEVLLVSGIVARAAGNKSYINDFKRAAALDPARELPSEKYSPETKAIYSRISSELLSGDKVFLFVDGTPADASIMVGDGEPGGVPQDAGYLVLPGKHFIHATAPGYEPWALNLDVERFEPAKIHFELVPSGPEGDPDDFFLQRLRANDRSYMILLAEKLDVDYIFIPDPDKGVLKAWLVDREGRYVDHVALWETGDTRESGAQRIAEVLGPLRQEWNHSRTTAGAPLSLPALSQDLPDNPITMDGSTTWSKYAIAIGVLLLVGAAAAADKSGSTRIEATW